MNEQKNKNTKNTYKNKKERLETETGSASVTGSIDAGLKESQTIRSPENPSRDFAFEVRPLQTDSAEMDQVYNLYQSAFPEYERKPFEMVLDGMESGKMKTYSIFYDGRYAGLIFLIPGADVDVLDYLAIHPAMRSHGLGARALAWLKEDLSHPFVVEIESTFARKAVPDDFRRKDFYLRNGMKDCCLRIELFSVEMELLSSRRPITFNEYYSTMQNYFGDQTDRWLSDKIQHKTEPAGGCGKF